MPSGDLDKHPQSLKHRKLNVTPDAISSRSTPGFGGFQGLGRSFSFQMASWGCADKVRVVILQLKFNASNKMLRT